jgi:2Fe-2S ferredoxin
MTTLVFIRPGGERITVEAGNAESAMQAAVGHRVDGILGECGGSLTCATCHVFVEPEWLHRLPAMSEAENELLDATATTRRDNSRLSCQIPIEGVLDGLVLHLPEAQI